jgi:mannose-6-phosphate isomerase-like protein (cupin superfamily)
MPADPMPSHRHARYTLEDVCALLPAAATDSWPDGVWDHEVWRDGTVSISLFAPRGTDHQSVHEQDEAYVIASGRGTLLVDGEAVAYAPGDVVVVRAGQEHHFEEPLDDLAAWVVFWGGAAATDPVSVVGEFLAAWEALDVDAAMTLMAADCWYSMTTGSSPGREFRGSDEVRRGFAEAMPVDEGTRVHYGEPVGCGAKVLLEWQVRASSDDTRVLMRGVDVFTVADGKITGKDAFRKVSTTELATE